MNPFYIYAACLLLIGLALRRRRQNVIELSPDHLHKFREQLSELDNELASGLLSVEQHRQARQELQAHMFAEANMQAAMHVSNDQPSRLLALLLVALIPVLVWVLDGWTAHPLPRPAAVAENRADLKALEVQVVREPDNAEAWLALARLYNERAMFPDTVRAYENLTRLKPGDGELWADYADVLAMLSGQRMAGKPTELLDKALILSPDNAKVLALSGSAAMERGDYKAAQFYWEKLLKQLPKGTAEAMFFENGIAQARLMQGAVAPSAEKPQRVSGVVRLSDELISGVSPNDTVVIMVRAEDGPGLPLVEIHKQVRELPLKFVLDDSVSPVTGVKFSDFKKLVLSARIAGGAGELQGSVPIQVGQRGIELIIRAAGRSN